jgi:hypothetical protein
MPSTKTLTIQFEACEPIKVDLDNIRQQKNKNIRDGLQSLLISDYPHLVQLIRDRADNYDVEIRVPQEGAPPAEIPLSIDSDWESNVVSACEKLGVAELSIAEHISGGADDDLTAVSQRPAQKDSPASVPKSGQTVTRHPADYQLTDDDKEKIRLGRAIYITGRALAMATELARYFGSDEFIFYWAANQDNRYLITNVILPQGQEISSGSVRSSGSSVIHCVREARERNMVLIAAGHSHGANGAVWSSVVDVRMMLQLVSARYGWPSTERKEAVGRVSKNDTMDRTDKIYELDYDTTPHPPAVILLKTVGDLPADLSVEVQWEHLRRDVSSFSTHNANPDDIHMPLVERSSCPRCGGKINEQINYDAEVHIVGEQVMTDEEKEGLLAEAQRKGARRFGYYQPAFGKPHWSSATQWPMFPAQSCRPDDYRITRKNKTWIVPAAVIEQAATACSALAEAIFDEDQN